MPGSWRGGSERPAGWRGVRAAALARDRWTCQDCGGHAREVDHIIPRSRGGSDAINNLRAICKACHAIKSSREGNDARWAVREARAPESHPGFR